MNGPNSAGFMTSMEKEIETPFEIKAPVVVNKKNWMNVVYSIWAFKRKWNKVVRKSNVAVQLGSTDK